MDAAPALSEAALLDQNRDAKQRNDAESLCAVLRAHTATPVFLECLDALYDVVCLDHTALAAALACGAVSIVVGIIREQADAPSNRLAGLVALLAQFTAAPGALPILRAAGAFNLVCALLRTHIDNVELVGICCATLTRIVMQHGDDVPVEAADLAELAARRHLQRDIQAQAKRLIKLLAPSAAPSGMDVSPEHAALARVEELKARRDFASLVRDMDAFPELEELQRAGCLVICDILVDDRSLQHEAAAAGVVECVIRALNLFQHSATTQRISLKVFYVILASEVEAILYAAGNAGAVRLAVRVLRSFPENARVIDHAFGVLGHLVKLQQCCEEALSRNALMLSIAALRRCKDGNMQGEVCICLSRLCESDDAIAADALSMGAMELALAALRTYRSTEFSCIGASLLLYALP